MANTTASKDSAKTAQSAKTTTPATWQPFADLRTEIERVFDNFVPGWFDFPRLPATVAGARFDVSPKVDVAETDKEFRISAELPGLDEKDVEVTLNDGVLTIKGEKSEEKEHKGDGEQVHWTERSYGSFQRSFRVPDSVEADKVGAEFKKGVLCVTLPKSASAQTAARKIKISS